MDLKEFLAPTKLKIILAILIVPFVFNLIIKLCSIEIITPIAPPLFISVFSYEFLIYIIIPFIFLQIPFCYPIACLIAILYYSLRKKQIKRLLNKKDLFYITGLIIIFNPVSYFFLSYYIISSMAQPCGVSVSNIFIDSPAEKAGILPGSTIYYINEKPIYNPNSLQEILKNTKPGDKISLQIMLPNKKIHNIEIILSTPPEGLNVKGGFLGISNITISLKPYCRISK